MNSSVNHLLYHSQSQALGRRLTEPFEYNRHYFNSFLPITI